jgi:hypothetical protein
VWGKKLPIVDFRLLIVDCRFFKLRSNVSSNQSAINNQQSKIDNDFTCGLSRLSHRLSRAVGTTIEVQIGLDAVADDPATTLITVRR